MSNSRKYLKAVQALAAEHGWVLDPDRTGHVKIRRAGCKPIIVPRTPNDHDWTLKIIRAHLKRGGMHHPAQQQRSEHGRQADRPDQGTARPPQG